MSNTDKTDDTSVDQHPAPSLLEWSVRAISIGAITALIIYLIIAATRPHVGPNFIMEVEATAMEERRNGWAVPVQITNKGTVAIAQLHYQIEQRAGSTTTVAKSGLIGVLGAGETVDTEVWFKQKPDPSTLHLVVDTYAL
ncbi:MAG: hypothetical protein HKN49_14165 [Gammaproteobacteria bacterium]|nr:hypothetical protein [Gammaproteobacteria bacterium]